MSAPRPQQPVPRRHLVPGLLAFTAFIGLSLAGQARIEARRPPPTAFEAPDAQDIDPDEFDPFAFGAPDPSEATDEADAQRELVAEAGDLGEAPPVVAQKATASKPPVQNHGLHPPDPSQAVEPPTVAAPTEFPATRILTGLEAALAGLAGAGRDPGNVMVAVQQARTHLQQVERDLKALRGTETPGLAEAERAHGRLTRASFEFDSAARRSLTGSSGAMGDPFSGPERLLDESRARLAAARQAMADRP